MLQVFLLVMIQLKKAKKLFDDAKESSGMILKNNGKH